MTGAGRLFEFGEELLHRVMKAGHDTPTVECIAAPKPAYRGIGLDNHHCSTFRIEDPDEFHTRCAVVVEFFVEARCGLTWRKHFYGQVRRHPNEPLADSARIEPLVRVHESASRNAGRLVVIACPGMHARSILAIERSGALPSVGRT